MIRIIGLELKKILKNKLNLIVTAIGIALTIISSFAVISFEGATLVKEDGKTELLKGYKAIKVNQKYYNEIKGDITPKVIKDSLEKYQNVMEKYQINSTYDAPEKVRAEILYPRYDILNMLQNVEIKNSNAEYIDLIEISPNSAEQFYDNR